MLSTHLDSIDESHLNALVTNGVRESRSLDFKAKLALGSDAQKKEFLADVSAFANGGGGDLVLGIEEKDGAASEIVGLDSFHPDNDTLRIESIVREGIAPHVIGMRVCPVALKNDRWAVIIRVPNSLNRPHMVVFKNWSRFYSRNSAGKYQLDVHELKSAFVASESTAERIRQFRIERTDAILQGSTPVPLAARNHICVHLIPISAFDPSFSFDLLRVQEQGETLRPIGQRGWNPSVNFDGLLFFTSTSAGEPDSYVQLFRNGVIEAVDCYLLASPQRDPQAPRYIPSIANETEVIEAVKDYTGFYKKHEVPAPVLLGLSMLNVKGFHMAVYGGSYGARPVDRDHLVLPDRLLESLSFNAASFLRPCFDQIWNACGYTRSMNYDEQGNWQPRG